MTAPITWRFCFKASWIDKRLRSFWREATAAPYIKADMSYPSSFSRIQTNPTAAVVPSNSRLKSLNKEPADCLDNGGLRSQHGCNMLVGKVCHFPSRSFRPLDPIMLSRKRLRASNRDAHAHFKRPFQMPAVRFYFSTWRLSQGEEALRTFGKDYAQV